VYAKRDNPVPAKQAYQLKDIGDWARHCGLRIIGHGLQKGDRIFCCDHCAEKKGVTELRDRA